MSHFSLYIVVPESHLSLSSAAQKAHLSERLAPFDEGTKVTAYEQACYCVGRTAASDAKKSCDVNARIGAAREQLRNEAPEPDEATLEARWQTLIAPILAEEKAAFDVHPMKGNPDADCEECHGTAKVMTQYNPKSQWDWWSQGGRWTGTLGGQDPEKNPANWKTCDLCGGTGKRDDVTARINPDQMKARHGCNGCDGKGRMMKWPTDWVSEGNMASVASFLALDEEEQKKRTPFAILLADGTWCQRGKMGWFGMVRDERAKDEWVSQTRAVLETVRGDWLVCVDCHI